MPRPVHFEIHATDPERMAGYYRELFGWTVNKVPNMEYWLVITGPDGTPGINGGLFKRRGPAPVEGQAVNAYVCTVDVADVDASVRAAIKLGGGNVVPRQGIRGVGWLAYCVDPEGNIFGLMQNDPEAA